MLALVSYHEVTNNASIKKGKSEEKKKKRSKYKVRFKKKGKKREKKGEKKRTRQRAAAIGLQFLPFLLFIRVADLYSGTGFT